MKRWTARRLAGTIEGFLKRRPRTGTSGARRATSTFAARSAVGARDRGLGRSSPMKLAYFLQRQPSFFDHADAPRRSRSCTSATWWLGRGRGDRRPARSRCGSSSGGDPSRTVSTAGSSPSRRSRRSADGGGRGTAANLGHIPSRRLLRRPTSFSWASSFLAMARRHAFRPARRVTSWAAGSRRSSSSSMARLPGAGRRGSSTRMVKASAAAVAPHRRRGRRPRAPRSAGDGGGRQERLRSTWRCSAFVIGLRLAGAACCGARGSRRSSTGSARPARRSDALM